jgi:Methyltransferase domain
MNSRLEVPQWGNLRRTRPFSDHFGFDRGTPIDRYYVLKFIREYQQHITGNVLEIQSGAYTNLCGHDIRRNESVDIDPQHGTTYVCDLAHSDNVLATSSYDCFLLPNTLNHLKDVTNSMRHALRVIRPGGVVLATAPTLTSLTPDFSEYQRFTTAGLRELVESARLECEYNIESYGNVLAATAALMGIVSEELTTEELDTNDPRYPVLITLFCKKPA